MKILVNSLPKSGTHLLGKLLICLGFSEWEPGLTGDLLRETHRNPYRNLKKRARRPRAGEQSYAIDLDIENNRASKRWLSRYLNRIPEGHFLTGHLPYSYDLSAFLQIHGYRVIQIMRDPRDVLISYINFQKNWKNNPFYDNYREMSLSACVERVMHGSSEKGVVTKPLNERIESAIGWTNDERVCSVRFECLVGPEGGGLASTQLETIANVCRFLDLKPDDDEIKNIANNVFDRKSETFYKGQIGQWQSAFQQQELDVISDEIGSSIRELGYEL